MTSTIDDRVRSFSYFLIRVLVLASLLELVVKLLWRTGTYLPLKGVLATIYFTLHPLQGVLFNFASLLTFVVLGVFVYVAHRGKLWEGRFNPVILVSVSVLLTLSAAGIVLSPSNHLALLYVSASSVAVVALAGYAMFNTERLPAKLAVALFALAFLSYRYYVAAHVVNNLSGSASEPFLAIEILALGELLFALSPFAVFVAYTDVRKPRDLLAYKLPLAVATGAAVAFAVASALSPAMTSVYAIWMLGFSLQHPIFIYLLSAWFLFFTLAACMKHRETRYVAYALLLIFVSGYTHKFTYHHLLGLMGLIVLIKGRKMGVS
jgi:hypothetical protein